MTFLDAGHVPGSAHVLVDDGETRLLYTGDFHTDDQRLVAGTEARPEADVVIVESTYADVEHPDRDALEREFVESLETTLWEGGTVVVPAFAIGRTQEVMLICAPHDIEPYVDGMGTRVTRLLRRHPGFLRDAEALRRAKGNARFVTGRDGRRGRIAAAGNVIVTTSGMLGGEDILVLQFAKIDRWSGDRISSAKSLIRDFEDVYKPSMDRQATVSTRPNSLKA